MNADALIVGLLAVVFILWFRARYTAVIGGSRKVYIVPPHITREKRRSAKRRGE